MEAIKTDKLTKYYGKARGIIDLNLSVEKGESFGFIGPNGAGKSTTIRTLLGLISPTSGSAQIFGKDITKEKKAILQDIGYLPSEAVFYPGMKVKDILTMSADMRKINCTKEAKKLCERLQLELSPAAIIRDGRMIACNSMGALAKTNAKRVAIHGNVSLDGLDGIRDKTGKDGSVSFLYSGDINLLLKTLSTGHITDLSVSEPDLEEIFLHYYEKDGDKT